MHEAAASCKDIIWAPVTTCEPHGVSLTGYCYAVRHRMKVQLVTLYHVSHLQSYEVTELGYVVTLQLCTHLYSGQVQFMWQVPHSVSPYTY